MREQHVLDLARRHVLAATYDDVVDAALEEEIALVVQEAAVPGGEEAVGADQRSLAQVLTRHLLAAHVDLAALAGGHGLAVLVADLELERR